MKNRLPTMGWNRDLAEAGSFMSYGQSLAEQFRYAASYVDRILKGDLPIGGPHQARVRHQPQDGAGDRHPRARRAAGARRRGHSLALAPRGFLRKRVGLAGRRGSLVVYRHEYGALEPQRELVRRTPARRALVVHVAAHEGDACRIGE